MKLNLCSMLLDYYYSWLPDFMRCELESYYYVSSLMVQGFDTKCTWSDPNCLRIWIWAHKSSGGPRLTNNFSNADVD